MRMRAKATYYNGTSYSWLNPYGCCIQHSLTRKLRFVRWSYGQARRG